MYFQRVISLAAAMLLFFSSAALAGRFFSETYVPRAEARKVIFDSIPNGFRSDRIIVKFREESRVRLRSGSLVSLAGVNINVAKSVIETDIGIAVKRLFSRSEIDLDAQKTAGEIRCNRQLADLNLYYMLILDKSIDPVKLIGQLNELPEIEIAYPEPIPVPAYEPLSPTFAPDFQAEQGYLNAAPDGIDAYFAWGIPGCKGENIRVCDIEGDWVFTHEDLSNAWDSIHICGDLIPEPLWYNHGTAVLGTIAADSNGGGVTGIVFNVSLNTVAIGDINIADAIDSASANVDSGDVILIELQEEGPNSGHYVPVEFYQAEFDAISAASAMGRIVVEAGANGGEDLDDPYWYGQLFDPDYRHSGAILVGAGTPSSHSPEWFSSYGKRLDLQGWGSDIYTLGYGDLYAEGDTSHWYTADFGGTSGASPIVVGAVAALRGAYEEAYGIVLTRDEIVDILDTTGTPQGEPIWKNIGPLPDIKGAIESTLAIFTADSLLGFVPFAVPFEGWSPDSVIEWIWDFGDGDSAYVENPTHIYDEPGVYDVSLSTVTLSGTYSMIRRDYVAAILDSIRFSNEIGQHGDTVEISVYGRNDVPIERILLPFRYAGAANLIFDTFTTAGTRCEYFEQVNLLFINIVNKEATIELVADSGGGGGTPPLPTGSGELIRLRFIIGSQTPGDMSSVDSMNLVSYSLSYLSAYGEYIPFCESGSVIVSGPLGDANGSGVIDIDDVVYLVAYVFSGGPEPVPYPTGDVDCSGQVDIDDVVFLINFIFGGGPEPNCP